MYSYSIIRERRYICTTVNTYYYNKEFRRFGYRQTKKNYLPLVRRSHIYLRRRNVGRNEITCDIHAQYLHMARLKITYDVVFNDINILQELMGI